MGDRDASDAAAICRRPVLQAGGTGGRCVFGKTTSSGSSSSLFSSTSGLTEDDDDQIRDDATSSPLGRRPDSSLTSSDKMQMDGDAAVAGPLYELSTMLDHLPSLRTGLSAYYRGRSQSFTSLADVSCVHDLAKKTTPYIRRTKAPRCYAAALGAKNQLSRKIAKKVQSSSDSRLSSRARNTSLFLRSSKRPPPTSTYHGKR